MPLMKISLFQVAVKIMDINKIKEDYVLKNLYREAKLMAKLNHPNVTSLFETMQVRIRNFTNPRNTIRISKCADDRVYTHTTPSNYLYIFYNPTQSTLANSKPLFRLDK